MNETDFTDIFKSQCLEYAKDYGCLEINHISGSPFYCCEINGVPTALYPVLINDTAINEIDLKSSELWVSHYKNSHKIVRIEIIIDNDINILQTRAITIYDLISRNAKNDKD